MSCRSLVSAPQSGGSGPYFWILLTSSSLVTFLLLAPHISNNSRSFCSPLGGFSCRLCLYSPSISGHLDLSDILFLNF
jgi:hypothetical protein